MNTGRNSKQTTCLCRDTGGKGTLPAQRTGFSTLDNWGHKTPTQSKKEKGQERKVKESCIQYTQLHIYIYTILKKKMAPPAHGIQSNSAELFKQNYNANNSNFRNNVSILFNENNIVTIKNVCSNHCMI